MIRRRPFLSLLLLILLFLVALAWQNRVHLQAFPGIVGAYSAKEYCSCRYVANNPADYCKAYVTLYMPLSGFFDDAINKRVTARGLGSSQSAQWQGARQGCQLLPEAAPLPDA
ncbi:MAG: amidase [Pseudomonas sp.]|uniref:amidase n=1 Tax=Pseudomonas sp. TaxID=306 RepID=UPI003982CEBD